MLPPLTGVAKGLELGLEELPAAIRRAYLLLRDSLVEAKESPHPIVVFLVGEWGDGRSSVYEVLVAPLAESLGARSVYTRPSLTGGVEGLAVFLKDSGADIVFVDEAEDIVYSSEAPLFAKLLLGHIENGRGASVVVALTPAAFSKLAALQPRGVYERLARRARIIVFEEMDWASCLGLAEAIAGKTGAGLDALLEDPRLLLPLAHILGCNAGGVAAALRIIASRSASLASQNCGGRGFYRLSALDVLEIARSLRSGGRLALVFNEECYEELLAKALSVATSKGYRAEAVEELVAAIVAKGFIGLEEAAGILGASLEEARRIAAELVEGLRGSCGVGDALVVGEANALPDEWKSLCKHSSCRGVLLAVSPRLFEKIFMSPRKSLLYFVASSEREALARITPSGDDLANGYSLLLSLYLLTSGARVDRVVQLGDNRSAIEASYGSTRLTILVSVSGARLDASVVISGVKPHIVLVAGSGDCREGYLEDLHALLLCHRLRPEDLHRIGVVGRVAGDAGLVVRGLEGLREALAGRGIVPALLEDYAERVFEWLGGARGLLEKAVTEASPPIVLHRDPAPMLRSLVRSFTLYLGPLDREAMTGYLEVLAALLPPRPKSKSIVPLRPEKALEDVESLEYLVEPTPWERLLLKALEFYGGRARLDDLAYYSGAAPGRVREWLRVLEERGLIELGDGEARLVHEPVPESIERARELVSSLERAVEGLGPEWAEYCVPFNGSVKCSRLEAYLALATAALGEARSTGGGVARRIARGVEVLARQGLGLASCLAKASKAYRAIVEALGKASSLSQGFTVQGLLRVRVEVGAARLAAEALKHSLSTSITPRDLQVSCYSPRLARLAASLRLLGLAEREWRPLDGLPRRLVALLGLREKLERVSEEYEERIGEVLEALKRTAQRYSLRVAIDPVAGGEVVVSVRDPGEAEYAAEKLREEFDRITQGLVELRRELEALVAVMAEAESVAKKGLAEAERARRVSERIKVFDEDISSRLVGLAEDLESAARASLSLLDRLRGSRLEAGVIAKAREELRDTVTIVKDLLDRLRGVEREAARLLAVRVHALEEAVSKLSGQARTPPYRSRMDWYTLDIEAVVEAYEKTASLWREAVRAVAEKGLLGPVEAKAFVALAEAKTRYGELLLSEASRIISERTGLGLGEAKKAILSLIERGLLDPKV